MKYLLTILFFFGLVTVLNQALNEKEQKECTYWEETNQITDWRIEQCKLN